MQQVVTPMNERLAWLAGIIDGEGTVTVQTTSSYRKSRGYVERSFNWKIDISNTNAVLINEVTSILDDLDIRFFFAKYKGKKKNHKDVTKVVVNGMPRVLRFLGAVLPWLVGKKPQAELLLRMSDRRKSLPYHSKPFNDSVLTAGLAEMRRLNQRGVNKDALVSLPDIYSTREVLSSVVRGRGKDNIPTEEALGTAGRAGGS